MDMILYLAIPLFLALLALEFALLRRAPRAGRDVRGARREDTLASLAMGAGNVAISGGVKVFLLVAYLWTLRIAFHEWAALGRDLTRATTWRARPGALFAAPGWSADGTTQTVRQLRTARDAELRRLTGEPGALAADAPGLPS